MLSRLFGRGKLRPELTLDDVAQYIPDPERAPQALWDLQYLVSLGLADVYLPAGWVAAGHRRFNVWLDRRMAPPSGQRITLEDWCARWFAREDGWRQWVANVLRGAGDPGGAA
jgi:hypothetical protein